MPAKQTYIKIKCAVITTTGQAVMIQNDQTGMDGLWLPRVSLAWESDKALDESDMGGRDLESLKVVDWMARKHGLA